jgi:molybdenum cofactor cytidylyltransferase
VGSAGLLLAAGESTRMGQSKPLLPWKGTTLVRFQADQLLEAGLERVIVVAGYRADAVKAALEGLPPDRVAVVVNEAYAQGKVGSILRGLRALGPAADPILVLSVDQPRPAWLIRQVLDAHGRAQAPLTIPTYQGRGGHPTVFAGRLYPEMLAINEESQGLRALVERYRALAHRTETGTPLTLLDLNEPEDYATAQALFSGADS